MKRLLTPTPKRTRLSNHASGSVVRSPRAPLAIRRISENSPYFTDSDRTSARRMRALPPRSEPSPRPARNQAARSPRTFSFG